MTERRTRDESTVREGLEGVVATATRLSRVDGEAGCLTLAGHAVEETALRLLREAKPERRIDTNVEFYTALLLHGLGLPAELFTPVFAVGRTAGWTAHALEQRSRGRLIRPSSVYIGAEGREALSPRTAAAPGAAGG